MTTPQTASPVRRTSGDPDEFRGLTRWTVNSPTTSMAGRPAPRRVSGALAKIATALVALVLVTGCGSSGPPDQRFVAALREHGVGLTVTDATLVSTGQNLCQEYDSGQWTEDYLVTTLIARGLPSDDARYFLDTSLSTLCPDVTGQPTYPAWRPTEGD